MSSETIYEACPTRRRRTKVDIAGIRQAIRDVVGEDPPMTVRQVFYQLVVAGAIEKTEAECQGTVIRLLTDMSVKPEEPKGGAKRAKQPADAMPQ